MTLVDDTHVYIGDHVMFGPNVTISAAGHPIEPELREKAFSTISPSALRTTCGWRGSVILPGVTIGKNSVIGAGSVVTKDIPAGVVALGVPCRVLREIGGTSKAGQDHFGAGTVFVKERDRNPLRAEKPARGREVP